MKGMNNISSISQKWVREPSPAPNNEKVVEYSLNGMMKRFQRRGKKSDGEYGKVDNLHIHLDGNRPVEISDDAALQTVYGAMEFRDGSTSGTEYYYDGNGSLVADANKGIAC